jgi:hypothetical protein
MGVMAEECDALVADLVATLDEFDVPSGAASRDVPASAGCDVN